MNPGFLERLPCVRLHWQTARADLSKSEESLQSAYIAIKLA